MNSFRIALILEAACACLGWRSTASGVHSFLTFDSGLNDSMIELASPLVEFVWGGHAPALWHASNAEVVVSSYMTFNRDPDAQRNLSWWQTNHPSWVIYKCDRETPATPDTTDTNIPLDISNPDVISWQLGLAEEISGEGFDAIAADNFDVNNDQQACGVWESPGVWRNLYNGTDAAFVAAQVSWLATFRRGLHDLQRPLLLVPNFVLGDVPFNSSLAEAIASGVDGILDERGFTGWGAGFLSPEDWDNTAAWATMLQETGRAFFAINEWGDAPTVPAPVREWAVASWLMSNVNASAVFLSCVQCYGNWAWSPEFALPVGSPLGPRTVIPGSAVWLRTFSTGALSLVNPVLASNATVSLPAGVSFVDAEGTLFVNAVVLPGGSGLTLVPQAPKA